MAKKKDLAQVQRRQIPSKPAANIMQVVDTQQQKGGSAKNRSIPTDGMVKGGS